MVHANLARFSRPVYCRSLLTCGRLNHVRFATHFLDDCVHLDGIGDPGRQPGDEVRVLLARNLNLSRDKSIYVINTYCFRDLASARALPAAKHAHRFWNDRSKCNTLRQERAPIPPGERRQSAEPTAVPVGRRLRGGQRDLLLWTMQLFFSFLIFVELL